MKRAVEVLSEVSGIPVTRLLERTRNIDPLIAILAMERFAGIAVSSSNLHSSLVADEMDKVMALKMHMESKYGDSLFKRYRNNKLDNKQIFMYLSAKYTSASHARIAQCIGLRSHASVFLAVKSVSDVISVNQHEKVRVDTILGEWKDLINHNTTE